MLTNFNVFGHSIPPVGESSSSIAEWQTLPPRHSLEGYSILPRPDITLSDQKHTIFHPDQCLLSFNPRFLSQVPAAQKLSSSKHRKIAPLSLSTVLTLPAVGNCPQASTPPTVGNHPQAGIPPTLGNRSTLPHPSHSGMGRISPWVHS